MDDSTYRQICETLEKIRHRLDGDKDIISIYQALSPFPDELARKWLQALTNDNDQVSDNAISFLIRRGSQS